MAEIFDPTWWVTELTAEIAVIWNAPIIYVSALIVGWLVGWIIIRAWYRREIRTVTAERQSAQTATNLAESERDLERRQKEGLRQAILEMKPGTSVLAMEIGYGDPDVLDAVGKLAAGEKIQIPINPLHPTSLTIIPARLTAEQIKQIAVTAYTTGNSVSQIERSTPFSTTIGSSLSTASIDLQVRDLPKKKQFEA